MNVTEELSKFCNSVTYSQLTPSTILAGKRAIIDTHGVIHSGYQEPVSGILFNWVEKQNSDGNSTILGYEMKTSPNLAALVNGTMGHAIDYDDVSSLLKGHPSIPVYAAVLAVAEHENKSGADIITAFLLGVEVMTKLGGVLSPSHYYKGWHATSTLGVIGAAIAVGKLYNFSQEQFQTLIGLSSTMMSGLMANFGTMTKPFHIGYAARNGIEAAQLVRDGLTASKHILESEIGVFRLYTDEDVNNDWIHELGNPWTIEEPGFSIKRYPCCYGTHRFADAAYFLTTEYPLELDDIEGIECIGPKSTYVPLIYDNPTTGLEGKFSLEYVVSAMLVDKKLTIDSFTDEMVNRPNIRQLMKKVSRIVDDSIYEDREKGIMGTCQVKVKTKNKEFIKKVSDPKGSANNPLNLEELKEKFVDCLTKTKSQGPEILFESMLNLENENSLKNILRRNLNNAL